MRRFRGHDTVRSGECKGAVRVESCHAPVVNCPRCGLPARVRFRCRKRRGGAAPELPRAARRRSRLDGFGLLRKRLLPDPQHRPAGSGRSALHARICRLHGLLAHAGRHDDRTVPRAHERHGLDSRTQASARALAPAGLDDATGTSPHDAGRGAGRGGLPHGTRWQVALDADPGAGRDGGLRPPASRLRDQHRRQPMGRAGQLLSSVRPQRPRGLPAARGGLGGRLSHRSLDGRGARNLGRLRRRALPALLSVLHRAHAHRGQARGPGPVRGPRGRLETAPESGVRQHAGSLGPKRWQAAGQAGRAGHRRRHRHRADRRQRGPGSQGTRWPHGQPDRERPPKGGQGVGLRGGRAHADDVPLAGGDAARQRERPASDHGRRIPDTARDRGRAGRSGPQRASGRRQPGRRAARSVCRTRPANALLALSPLPQRRLDAALGNPRRRLALGAFLRG